MNFLLYMVYVIPVKLKKYKDAEQPILTVDWSFDRNIV